MKRLLLSTKALWHQWRALRLARHARSLLDAADAHAAEAAMNLLASRSLARGPLPKPAEPDQQPGGCSFAAQSICREFCHTPTGGLRRRSRQPPA